jgi:hypothetical protein
VFNTLSDNKLVDSVELKDDLATIKKIYKNWWEYDFPNDSQLLIGIKNDAILNEICGV